MIKAALLQPYLLDVPPTPDAAGDGTRHGRFTDLGPDKLRGGYYTPPEVADWMCAWAIRSRQDTVLEPSCGDGAFLAAAISRLIALGTMQSAIVDQLIGVEFVAPEAERAEQRLSSQLGPYATGIITCSDFFTWWKSSDHDLFDVVVGNPPFIRYQSFPEPHRAQGMAIMEGLGLTPNRLTNIWVPFVAAAAACLRPGGRLAFVLPAELLQVSYAAQLRSHLTDRFARIDIIACNELFFPNAQQEVVLLLADGALPAPSPSNECRVTLTETRTVTEIVGRTPRTVLAGAEPKTISHDHEKWLKYFLTPSEITLMRELRAGGAATPLLTHASIDVGVVTGRNEFFVLTDSEVEALGLTGYTVPLISRSAHLRGARIKESEWKTLAIAGDRVHLLSLGGLNGTRLPPRLAAYIASGEARRIHTGYKCSVRDPWYVVPTVWIPDGFSFRQIYDFPRFVLNGAQATSTDTIHRLTCKANPAHVIANTYTHMTAASAEIEGRSYGGGVLELEPTESERLLTPTTLAAALPLHECDRLVRAGRLDDVLYENDRLVLADGMGLSTRECAVLRDIWVKMRDRRGARRRRPPTVLTESLG